MDKEEKELDAIYAEPRVLNLQGKELTVYYPMGIWRIIKKEYGGLDGITKMIDDNTMDFVMETMPILIHLGIINNENNAITVDMVQKYLDGYTIMGLAKVVLPVWMNALTGALPEPKESKVPTKAKKEQ